MTSPPVRFERAGRSAVIVLDRPQALNALTLPMVRAIADALDAWEHDDTVTTVVLTGAGDRALCAGGDIVAIHRAATGGDPADAIDFWREEYRLNARIARYPKPYVALMDGIVMGGGVGVSAHASTRLVTDRTRLAMPETGIGFVPDVGGTLLLARAPGRLGTHLALTAASIGAADALLCGLADHYLPADTLPKLLADLAELPLPEALLRHTTTPPPAPLAAHRGWIDHCYAAPTAEQVVERLRAAADPAAAEAAQRITANSPTAVKVALAALNRVHALGDAALETVLNQEFRTSCAALTTPDLAEGIRAQVVDKDRTPHWRPAALADVPDAEVERHFADLGPAELNLSPVNSPAGAVPRSTT